MDLTAFTQAIQNTLYENAPVMKDSARDRQKHKLREPLHMRDLVFTDIPIITDGQTKIFDVGSEIAEETHPYYHILQNAEVIRKKGKGTTKSKGSQSSVEVRKRDYERVSMKGKIFTKEYGRNIRGKRSLYDKATRYVVGTDGKTYKINADSNYYYNVHYRYIDRILDATMPYIAREFGLRAMRKKDGGLQEDYELTQTLDALNSMSGE